MALGSFHKNDDNGGRNNSPSRYFSPAAVAPTNGASSALLAVTTGWGGAPHSGDASNSHITALPSEGCTDQAFTHSFGAPGVMESLRSSYKSIQTQQFEFFDRFHCLDWNTPIRMVLE